MRRVAGLLQLSSRKPRVADPQYHDGISATRVRSMSGLLGPREPATTRKLHSKALKQLASRRGLEPLTPGLGSLLGRIGNARVISWLRGLIRRRVGFSVGLFSDARAARS